MHNLRIFFFADKFFKWSVCCNHRVKKMNPYHVHAHGYTLYNPKIWFSNAVHSAPLIRLGWKRETNLGELTEVSALVLLWSVTGIHATQRWAG